MDLYAMRQGDVIKVVNLVQYEHEETKFNLLKIDLKKRNKRGKIKKFSKESKKRLKNVLFKLKKQKLLFVTLTFEKNMVDGVTAKEKLDYFCRKISRRNKNVWFVWKMEFQKRGSIHYHLMMGGCDYKYARKILNAYWHEGFYHIKIAKKIDLYYFSKYVAKDVLTQNTECGRFWGIFNKSAIAFSKIELYYLSDDLKIFFQKIFEKKTITTINSSITIFT